MANQIVKDMLEKNYKYRVEPNWPLPEMVNNIIGDVGKHIADNEELKIYLASLPKGPFAINPDSPVEEQHKYIASRYGKIDKSDPLVVLGFMKNFVSEAAMLERKAIAYGADRIKDIAPDEKVMLTDPHVPVAIDSFWYRWFDSLVVPLEKLNGAEKSARKKELSKLMGKYDYTAFHDGKQLSWSEAFPTEVSDVVEALGRMNYLLNDKTVKKYIEKLILAYMERKVSDLEKRWADVDHAWIEIPNYLRVFPVHGMESGYEHPYGVSPEWRIMTRLDFGKKEINEIRDNAPKVASRLGADAEFLRQKLGNIDIGVFYTAVWSGVCMNFRYAGQQVPNRKEVQLRGGKIFMDLDSTNIAVERYKKILEKYFSEKSSQILIENVDPLGMIEHTAGHEISHPAGRTSESEELLGDDVKLLEEAKATMCGNLINESRSEDNRLKIVAETVARFCRFFHKTALENHTSAQYVRENMVACKTLFNAGVIKVDNGSIDVDIEKAKSRAWFEELENFTSGIFAAYKETDNERLKKLTEELCNKDEGIIAEIIALVNKE